MVSVSLDHGTPASSTTTMRFFAFLLCASFASAALVKREAEAAAEADPEAEPGYGLNVNKGERSCL